MIATLLNRLGGRGIELRRAHYGENRTACPQCARGGKDDALAVRLAGDQAVWICHRCAWSGAISATNSGTRQRQPPPKPLPPRTLEGYELARSIWVESIPLAGTLGEEYLRRRACHIPPPYADVRFHPRLFCVKVARQLPAIVCRVSTVIGNRGIGIHRIFIDPAGSDHAVAKMRLGGGDDPVCIRLYPDEDVTYGLAVAEGVETALAAARLHPPVWSTIDAGQLARFPLIAGIETLTVFADHDAAGLRAARACAERWTSAHRQVTAIAPARAGADANDLIREASHGR